MWTLQFWPRPLAHFMFYGQFDLPKGGNSNIASRCVRVGLVLRIAALVLLALPSSLAAAPPVHPVLQTQHRCCLRKGAQANLLCLSAGECPQLHFQQACFSSLAPLAPRLCPVCGFSRSQVQGCQPATVSLPCSCKSGQA